MVNRGSVYGPPFYARIRRDGVHTEDVLNKPEVSLIISSVVKRNEQIIRSQCTGKKCPSESKEQGSSPFGATQRLAKRSRTGRNVCPNELTVQQVSNDPGFARPSPSRYRRPIFMSAAVQGTPDSTSFESSSKEVVNSSTNFSARARSRKSPLVQASPVATMAHGVLSWQTCLQSPLLTGQIEWRERRQVLCHQSQQWFHELMA